MGTSTDSAKDSVTYENIKKFKTFSLEFFDAPQHLELFTYCSQYSVLFVIFHILLINAIGHLIKRPYKIQQIYTHCKPFIHSSVDL